MKSLWNGLRPLERNHIAQMLERAAEVPFTLVVAPMGYGKTTEVRKFLNKQSKVDKIWLALGQDEVDDIWIWQRFCDLLREADLSFYQQFMELGLPINRVEIGLAIKIIQNAFTKPFYFVIDDYHECNSKLWDTLLENIIYENIKNLHIIVISRFYPEISYDEMLIKGYCILIEQESLSLSKEELEIFFKENDVALQQEQLEQLSDYTDGWISAAYLALLSYKRNNKLEKFRSISQLLRTSIYNKLSEPVKDLLMKMSLFDNFTAEQASYIVKKEYSPAVMYAIAENVGFIKYNSVNDTFSLHALLKSVASVELENSEINKKELYNRCGEWYLKEKKFIRAIQNYQKAENTEKIFEIIETEYSFVLCEKAPSVIENFFQNLSKEMKLKHPVAYLQFIYAKIINVNSGEGIALFKEAKEYYEYTDIGIPKDKIMGELKILETITIFNDSDKMTECMKAASEMLKGGFSSIFHNRIIFTYGVPEIQTLYHREPGKLKNILQNLKKYNIYGKGIIKGLEGDWSQLFEAEYYFTIGKLEEANQLVEIACERAKFRKQICVIISSYFLQMRLDTYFGRKEKFEQHINELNMQMKKVVHPILISDYELATSFLYGKIKQYDKMASWLKDFKLEDCNRVIRSVRSGCTSYGLILIEKKQWIALEALAEEMLLPYGRAKHIFVFLTAYIYLTISCYYLYGMEKAIFYLEKAIELAEPDNIKMPFVENSEELYPMLKELEKKNLYVKELMPFCETYKKNIKKFFSEQEERTDISLTKREVQIIKLVAEGYKNHEICKMENIALVTVEKTLTNVYRKLQANNRTAAINKLRELKLL